MREYQNRPRFPSSYTMLAEAQVGWQLYRIWYESERIHESLGYQTPHQCLAMMSKSGILRDTNTTCEVTPCGVLSA